MRCNQDPTTQWGLNRDDRGQQFFSAALAGISLLVRRIETANAVELWRDTVLLELIEGFGELGRVLRRNGCHVEELAREPRAHKQPEQCAIGGVGGEKRIERIARDRLQSVKRRSKRLRDQPILLLDAPRDEIAHLVIDFFQLPVDDKRKRDENADKRQQLELEGAKPMPRKPEPRTLNGPVRYRSRSAQFPCANGIRRRQNSRFRGIGNRLCGT